MDTTGRFLLCDKGPLATDVSLGTAWECPGSSRSFQPNSTRVIIQTPGHAITYVDWRNGKSLRTWKTGDYYLNVNFSPDGKAVALGEDIYDLSSSTPAAKVRGTILGFCPTAPEKVLVKNKDRLTVRNWRTGRELAAVNKAGISYDGWEIAGDSLLLLFLEGEQFEFQLLDYKLRPKGPKLESSSTAILNPDGRTVALLDKTGIRLVDGVTGRTLRQWDGATWVSRAGAEWLLVSFPDRVVLCDWKLREKSNLPVQAGVGSLSADGKTLALVVAENRTLTLELANRPGLLCGPESLRLLAELWTGTTLRGGRICPLSEAEHTIRRQTWQQMGGGTWSQSPHRISVQDGSTKSDS